MNDDEIYGRIAIVEINLAALKAELAKREPVVQEWPREGCMVWYTLAEVGSCPWVNIDWLQSSLRRGLIYRTEAEARAADERRIVEARCRAIAAEGREFDSEWYEIYVTAVEIRVIIATVKYIGAIRFPTHESAQRAINELGDRLKVLL